MKNHSLKSIAVFCGSTTGSDPAIVQACLDLAQVLCAHKIALVYGGGNVGLMGILADETIRLGGEVIGVIPQKLMDIEVAHKGLPHLHIVPGMHERKALMARLADAFVVLPGGIGTLEEFFEIYTWLQLGYHEKPVALLNINGFYDMLIGFLRQLIQQGFIEKNQFEKLIIHDNSINLINQFMKLR
jgi:uncharacterized protein (TIGR00730 family)